ncbi:MAG: ABC transporter ATP-binding protein [Anaerolineaceae bacterium]|nr:ABC transporter ATP-binding protein [Anaerolineaceae bacterium]
MMHGLRRIVSTEDEKPNLTWPLVKRVLGYAKPYRLQLVSMLGLIFTGSGLHLINPLIFREMIDKTIPAGDVKRLIFLACALLLVALFDGVVSVLQRRLSAIVGEGVIRDLRLELYGHLQRMSLRFFTNTKTGELMSRLNNDVVGAQNAVTNTMVQMVSYFVQAVAMLGIMLALEWRLTLVSLVVLPLFLIVVKKLSKQLRAIVRRQLEANASMNAMMSETLNIGGALLVKLFGRQMVETDRFGKRANQVKDQGVLRAQTGSIFMAISMVLAAVGTALVYGLGGYFVIRGEFSIGTIVAFTSYLVSLYGSIQMLSNAPVDFMSSLVSFERVFEVIDLPPEIEEKPDAVVLKDVKGELRFENVTFTYQIGDEHLLSDVHRYGSMESVSTVLSEGEREAAEEERISQARGNALENVSFCVEPGKLVALVGPSGAGKTTLTYLIPRLYDPTEGSIYIDGVNLRDVKLESLSSQIGMVTQETYLFHDTIRTNLLYSRLDATQEEIEDACRAANIHDFIRELPEGYDTVVGERGYRLSGGEKQRISLARVILKDPRILVLDEATSSLDSESEALIQEALKRVMHHRTSIVIAHRLSTILAADTILVIDRGKIIESGTHPELLEMNGVYANLYHTQFRKREQTDRR